MKIILVKDIKGLGNGGEVVEVKNGYARNYLLPQKLAIVANKYNLTKIATLAKEAEAERAALESKYKATVLSLKDLELTFLRKADENDHLFGSVSEQDISEALAEKEIDVHKSYIHMDSHIKEIGSFDVKIHFTNEITADIKINVEKE
jgi:large subunit ribosomal protein L9